MIEAMHIPHRESLEVEFKSDRTRFEDTAILEASVALANTNGGTVFLGVDDDGTLTGLHPDHVDYLPLSAYIANYTVPPLGVRVQSLQQNGKAFLRIVVPKTAGILYATSSGRVLRRRLKADGTPESIPVFPQEIISRMAEIRATDYSAAVVPAATLEDLDPLEVARMRKLITEYSVERALL